jgi:DNA-binding response OmpR family regulator
VARFGDLVIDESRHEVAVDGAKVLLTPREFALLLTLASQPGRVFTRAQLLERVWGTEYYDDHVVDVHVANLRHKLGETQAATFAIETVRPSGTASHMSRTPEISLGRNASRAAASNTAFEP